MDFEKQDSSKESVNRRIFSNESLQAEGLFPSTDVGQFGETHRGLKSRHIQFLALGGCIGTGLFVGSGQVLSLVGPAPLLMSYIVMSSIIWVVMNNLGEMTTYMPVGGVSVPYFVKRYCEPSLAFAAGWNYWYSFSILAATEATAAALVLDYWTSSVPSGAWITMILLVCLILNIIAVSFFGEAEFWFASIKILAIIGLIITGVVIFFGGAPTHDRLGFRYWQNPGAFNPYKVSGGTGRFLAFWYAFVRSGFSFILSPELITTAAGEAEAPRRNIPKATKRFVYRLIAFYVLGSLVIGVIVPYNDTKLLSAITKGESGAGASPFVIGIQNAGIHVLNHIVNAAILTSAWSSGNSWIFAGSRSLYSLACNGQAPKIFKMCSKSGVPWVAVLATFAVSCLAYLNVSTSGSTVFTWFTNLTTISGFIAWIVVMITYLRFRKALVINGLLHTLPFKTPLQPYATYYALFVIIILTITNGFHVFWPDEWSAANFLAAYVTIPAFLVLYIGHKAWFRTPWMTSIDKVDVISGKAEMDRLAEMEVKPVPRNWLEKVWFWIA